jgi:hypothetical protein
MPIGIISSGGGGSTTVTGDRPWIDDGSVSVNLYVDNTIGDDVNFDGTSPTIGGGTVGPFATIARAIRECPIAAETARTINIAGTGVNYGFPQVAESLNKLAFLGVLSIASSETISSVNSSSRSVGLDLTIGSGMTLDTHRGKLVDFTSGPMSARYGWIYGNTATNVQVSQDTPGSMSFSVPSVGNTFDILNFDTPILLSAGTVITNSTQCTFRNIHFSGSGHINTISTDQIVFDKCLLEYERHQVGGFGRSLLLCSYLATTGHSQHGLLGVLNQAHVFLNRGTVVDSINASTYDYIRSASQSSWETDSEVVFKDVGDILWNGAHVMTRNDIMPGQHTWRFIDVAGIKGNSDDEAYWGAWDLPVCFGNVTNSYFLQGTRGCQGRIANGSSVTTATTINAVSADDGATAVADAADYTYFQGGDPAGIGNPMSPTSIEGVSNYGGNIALTETDSIIITPNDATNEIVIGETHSGDTSNPHDTKQIKGFLLNLDFNVPTSGVAALYNGDVTTSAAPIIVNASGILRGASVGVDAADVVRAYDLEVYVNSVLRETLSLATGVTETSTAGFTTAVVVNDRITVRLRRTSGSGKSTFDDVTAYLEILET